MEATKNTSSSTPSKGRIIAYWIATALVTFELIFGATWDFDLVNKSFVRTIMTHLGYPYYFAVILGVCKLFAAVALLAPRWPRLKEWAYAGTFIIFGGAVASHWVVGDSITTRLFPAIYAGLTLVSWAFRPSSRKLSSSPHH